MTALKLIKNNPSLYTTPHTTHHTTPHTNHTTLVLRLVSSTLNTNSLYTQYRSTPNNTVPLQKNGAILVIF